MCDANHLLDIAGLRARPVVLDFNSTAAPFPGRQAHYAVPVQSAPTNAALAIDARRLLRGVMFNILNRLSQKATGTGCSSIASPELLQMLAAQIGDALQSYEQATDIAIDNILASSDAQLDSIPSISEAAARAVAGGELSRAAAAHLLLGGDPGLMGTTASALCDDPKLTPQAQRALSIFRLSALSPSDVLDDTFTTSTLVTGTVPSGSVRARLEKLYDAGLITEITELGATDGLIGGLGLRTEDFAAARRYMQDELRAFSRSSTATLPAGALGSGPAPTFARYAATASNPHRQPAYWAALASYESDPMTATTLSQNYAAWVADTQNTVSPGLGVPGDLHVLSQVYERATLIKGQLDANMTLSDDIKHAILTAINPIVVEGQQRVMGTAWIYRNTSTQPASRGFTIGLPPHITAPAASGYRMVYGADGFECAATGTVEGATCDVASHTLTDFSQAPLACDTQSCYFVNINPTSVLGHPIFLMKKKGALYEPLAVAQVPGLAGGGTVYMPMAPEIFDRVAKVLSPSPEWCTRPETSCADESFDMRIPLEDELSNDGNDVESSWRHYLTLARQAAEEADMLGDQVLQLTEQDLLREEAIKLNQIQRAESSIEQLQEICGVDVDPTALLRKFSADGSKDFSTLRGTECSGSCSGNRACIAGRCVLSCT
ncbi:MAG TPA: hypothetical protein VK509_12030, partial [Polyangiales bacterium]|nr:hypothetical protein [Polyangiales bacterium]